MKPGEQRDNQGERHEEDRAVEERGQRRQISHEAAWAEGSERYLLHHARVCIGIGSDTPPLDDLAPARKCESSSAAPKRLQRYCIFIDMFYSGQVAPKQTRSRLDRIDPGALAAFQRRIRRRYSNEQILEELRASAKRLGRSPTMREFATDPGTSVHPQTVIEHFGSWNEAKREAGLVPRRFATREELLSLLRLLGQELGRVPSARDLDEHRGTMPSKSLYWHTFGSLTNALREAGFDVPVGEERLERALDQGVALARRLGRLPKFADWAEARKDDEALMTEWQIYRMLDARRGAWATFQFLIGERLEETGYEIGVGGRLVRRKETARGPRAQRGA